MPLFWVARTRPQFMFLCHLPFATCFITFDFASERFDNKNSEWKKKNYFQRLADVCFGHHKYSAMERCRVVVVVPILAYTVQCAEYNWILRREFRAVAVIKYFDHKNLYVREKDMLNQSNKYCTHNSPQTNHRYTLRTVTNFHAEVAYFGNEPKGRCSGRRKEWEKSCEMLVLWDL